MVQDFYTVTQDLNSVGTIKRVQKWYGRSEGEKITTFERAGAMELASNFGSAICWPYELRRLNLSESQNRGNYFRATERTTWETLHKEPNIYLAFNNLTKALIFQVEAFRGWGITNIVKRVWAFKSENLGFRIPSVPLTSHVTSDILSSQHEPKQ